MHIECDSQCEVYVDGAFQGTADSQPTVLEIPLFAQVLGIKGELKDLHNKHIGLCMNYVVYSCRQFLSINHVQCFIQPFLTWHSAMLPFVSAMLPFMCAMLPFMGAMLPF